MQQDEARKQSTTTPQALGKATGPSHEATRYLEGGTSTVTGPGRRKGTTEGEREKRVSGGRGPPTTQQKTATKEAPQHQRRHTKAKEKTTTKTQAETPTEKHHPEEPQQERNQGEDQKQTEGKESTAQNNQKQESKRGQDHEKASKRPHKVTAVGADH